MVECVYILLINFLFVCLMFIYVHADTLSFSYTGQTGPEKWGSLSPNNTACSNGKMQSPVDVVKSILTPNKKLMPLTRVYRTSNATLFNNGFNLGVICSSITLLKMLAVQEKIKIISNSSCLKYRYRLRYWYANLREYRWIYRYQHQLPST